MTCLAYVTYKLDVDDACLIDEVVAVVPPVHQVDGGQQVGRVQRPRLNKHVLIGGNNLLCVHWASKMPRYNACYAY